MRTRILLLLLLFALGARAQGPTRIFFTQASATSSLDQLKQADLSGTPPLTPTVLASDAANFGQPTDLLYDEVNNYIYVVDAVLGSGPILRYNVDPATGVATNRLVLVSGTASATYQGLALDPDNNRLYFSQSSATNSLDAVKMVDVSGTLTSPRTATQVAAGPDFANPNDMVFDKIHDYLYVIDQTVNTGTILRYTVAADGTLSGRTSVVAATGAANTAYGGLAVDLAGTKIYFTQYNTTGDATLDALKVATMGATTPYAVTSLASGPTHFAQPTDLVLDRVNNYLYVADQLPAGGPILRYNIDGSNRLVIIGTTASISYGGLALNGGFVTPLTLASSTPADNATGVSLTTNIQLTFDRAATKGSGNFEIVRVSDNTVVETIAVGSTQVTGSGTTWTIDPSITLASNTAYALRAASGIFTAADGGSYAGIADLTTLNFTTLIPPTTVASIDRVGASPTNAASVSFTVTFAQSITGLTTSNFSLSTTGVTGAGISSLSGSGTTYTVVVNTGSGSGSVGLNLANSTGLSPSVSNVPFTGQVYTIDKTAPAAPVAITPANGSRTSDNTPTYSGTAEASVSISVIVDGSSIGTTSSDASGNWTFTQPTALADGSHTLRATAADGLGNTSASSNTNTFTVDTTPPAAPVVLAPANGSSTNDNTPAYSGTAEASSTVNVIVDGSAISTTTANAGGNWAFTQPTALAEGSHTVRATATDAAGNTSVSSNTNTFTVDTVAPTVAISSTASPATTTSPIPVVVTFSQSVTGFTAAGVTVGNGTLSGFAGSGATYSFDVTPSGAGAVTVDVAANSAQDAAGNGNTAATQFSISYSLPTATVTAVTRNNPSPAGTATVSYAVNFSAAVTGLSTSNFSLTTTGLSGASVASVTGSGSAYTVLVNTGSGDGTLRLNVANSSGVSPSLSNLPYTSGQVYTIIKSFGAAPQLVLRTAGSASGLNDVTAFVDSVKVLRGGFTFRGGLQNNSFETNNVAANSFRYATTVVAAPWSFSGNTGVSRNSSGFGSTAAQGNAVGLLQTAGGVGGSIAQNLAVPTGSYQVNFLAVQRSNNGPSDQVVNVFLNNGTDDVYLGSIQPPSNTTYSPFTSATFSVTAPALTASITSTATNPTGTSPIPVTVTFSQSATGFVAGDVTVSNGTLSGFSGSGTTYTFNVTPSGTGLVTVDVPANSAVDANNTDNTAATQFTIQYNQPVTAAPVMNTPAHVSLINTATPTYTGTAPAGSTVTVYVDGSSIGTTTATGGNFSLAQPTALSQGSHTVNATAQTSGSTVSPTSNTNSFTVDTVVPAVTITSSTGATGSTSSSSPFAYTVTFSEGVSGFVAGDVTVGNGTLSGFSGASGSTTYTFNVTPTANGAVTVDVPAFVAQDAASNGNTAASTYTITYSQLVTAAPVVITPANGSATSDNTPTYSGTAPANSTVTVMVDGSSIGTATADASGNWTFTPSALLADGPHTAKATAQTSGQAVSPDSNTNAFVVDTTAPNTTLTGTPPNPSNSASATFSFTASDGGGSGVAAFEASLDGGGFTSASSPQSYTGLSDGSHTFQVRAIDAVGNVDPTPASYTWLIDTTAPSVSYSTTATNPTATSPIPVTVTFSEPVTGFAVGDLIVGNGTAGNFAGSGTTYTFDVTPAGNGLVTVDVPASAAFDAAGNGNSAAGTPQFSITFTTGSGWNGSVSTDWYTAANWTPATVPTSSLDAVIPAGAPRYPTISAGTAAARNLSIAAGASLTQTGGTLAVSGSWINDGTFTAPGGTVALTGAATQTVGGTATTRFWNLQVNSAGAGLSGAASVQRLLTLNGNLATNSQTFTLESTPTLSAMLLNSGGVVLGSATVQRAIDPTLNSGVGYHHYSSPVVSTTVGDLTTAGFTPTLNAAYNTSPTPTAVTPFPTVYGYDQSRLATTTNNLAAFDKGWFSPASTSDALVQGRGYTVNIGANQKVDFVGALRNTDLSLNLARNSGATATEAGWQLVGNPFPAPMDWSLVSPADRPNLDGSMYVYQSTSRYGGQYRFYVNGVGNPFIGVAQGFWVRVSQGQTAANLTLRNSQRLTAFPSGATAGANTFQRGLADPRPLVQLQLQGASGPADATYVYFESGATAGVDAAFDAVKLPNTSGLNLSAQAGSQELAINGLPLLGTAAVTVPLQVAVPATGSYTLRAAELLNLAGTHAYLRDRQTGALVDLSQQPSYSFTLNAAYIGVRFELLFSPQAVLATAPASLSAQVAVYPNPASKSVFVELPATLGRKAVTVVLVDALGRQVLEQTLPAAGAQAHQFPLLNVATGVYSVRISTELGTVTKKLVVE